MSTHVKPTLIDAILETTDPKLHADVRRVFALSPCFASLMRTATEAEWQALFVGADQALLPDGGADWVPTGVPLSIPAKISSGIPNRDNNDLPACMAHLRRCKQRAHRHLIWWEIGLAGDMDMSCQAIADLASGLLDAALNMAVSLIAARFGMIEGGSFCVIGLGKLGGRELNLGSDVDPLFVWQGSGHSSGGRKSVPVAEYYMHLSRMLIRLMGERTADGMVWPVDMRLRPGGDAASIALNLDATVHFYLEYGQTWERAMLVKARPVAGDLALGQLLIDAIAPFIYRRYLDYTTVAALADMKLRIDKQAGAGGIAPGFDVKRGRGGIREIEFIIQSLQLLHGGKHLDLRVQPSMQAISRLEQGGMIGADDVVALQAAYRFWRRIEHAIQARRGEQTHALPDDYIEYLEAATGIDHIHAQMQQHAAVVEEAFQTFVKPVDQGQTDSWLLGEQRALAHLNTDDRERLQQALKKIDLCLARGLLPERSRVQVERILAQAMPHWIDDANGVAATEAFAGLIYSISGRATWIDLLATHQGVLDWLIGVLSASRYLADHIVQDPSWLEWPLMIEHHDKDIDHICAELDGLNDFDDVEQSLADLGRWVDRGRLLSALAVDAHSADAMTIGGWMADVADAATDAALRLCLHEMALPADFPFVALAMGKHGSREMGLVSDLDMVFVLVHGQPSAMIGKRSYGEHAQRIGRRMIQYLSGQSPFGAGYAFDARLRPSGCSGVLVTSLAGFHDYQRNEAQTWEHQALCRARAAAGTASAKEQLTRVIEDVLHQPRDHQTLAEDVRIMRAKMLDHLASKSDQIMNVKHDAGGLVDIEFLAQYARLAFGIDARRTCDILSQIPAHAPLLWRQQSGILAATYLDYRQMENALRVELWRSIGKLPNDSSATEWETMHRHAAITCPDVLRQRMDTVHDLFQRLLSCNVHE
ncbi:MAG: bifunctional [glutamate--ammonia ligase]-adenylyl-L-tyrosine phosphorylase/[glutamate--ammonia-ligase] adenylyltransferase [Mariprofundus sp.]|nr:bifunctional [glutamate--ammonia ligase]-adenylyl-L-tyrosine phosphorylase/[glutamate--ammonia-ligase] adenylyltransferase [Mariprofundus sp.]